MINDYLVPLYGEVIRWSLREIRIEGIGILAGIMP